MQLELWLGGQRADVISNLRERVGLGFRLESRAGLCREGL